MLTVLVGDERLSALDGRGKAIFLSIVKYVTVAVILEPIGKAKSMITRLTCILAVQLMYLVKSQ